MGIMSMFRTLLRPNHSYDVDIATGGFKEENPAIAAKRKEALDKMAAMGRTPVVSGGTFSRKFTCLNPE
jgi:hypothetical protein